jgi:ornithine--oxo-acid transaminase
MTENAARTGELFRAELKKINLPWIREVRGRGLMNAMVVDPRGPIKAWDLCLKLKENGLLAKPTHDHIIRLAPPLVITEAQVRECAGIIRRTCESV